MRINEENIKEKLKNVSPENRVHLYDAYMVMQFLKENFENPKAIIYTQELAPYKQYDKDFFRNAGDYKAFSVPLKDFYSQYITWCRSKEFTSQYETYYQFSIIFGRMTFTRNGWQYARWRSGKEQQVMITPIIPKGKLPFIEAE